MSDLAPIAESVVLDPLVTHPAYYHVFHQFLERCKELPAITTAVVWPQSEVALRGTVEAADEGHDWTLRMSLRYAHSERYIRSLARQKRSSCRSSQSLSRLKNARPLHFPG